MTEVRVITKEGRAFGVKAHQADKIGFLRPFVDGAIDGEVQLSNVDARTFELTIAALANSDALESASLEDLLAVVRTADYLIADDALRCAAMRASKILDRMDAETFAEALDIDVDKSDVSKLKERHRWL
jgi:hypothetical protein